MTRFIRPALLGLAVLLAGAASPLAAQQPLRIAYVDVQQIMSQAPGLQEARTAFEGEVQRAQPELQRLAEELDSLQQEYQRQQATLTEAVRQQRQQDLQQRFATYQQRQQELQQREQELLAPITRRIEEVIEQVRREGGFAMIFDAMQSGIVAADESLDLTNRVLDRLRTGGQ
jgi:outer membrane protein